MERGVDGENEEPGDQSRRVIVRSTLVIVVIKEFYNFNDKNDALKK